METRPNLFQRGDVTLNSGLTTHFKIECDALTEEDWDTIGFLLADQVYTYREVHGVPRGGLPLAKSMERWVQPDGATILVVDDVWMTGGSVLRFIDEHPEWPREDIHIAVAFVRGPYKRQPNLTPLLVMPYEA